MFFEMCLPTTKLLLSFIVALQAEKKKKQIFCLINLDSLLGTRQTRYLKRDDKVRTKPTSRYLTMNNLLVFPAGYVQDCASHIKETETIHRG